jgi:threonylcarbamoyladenosine tRNA methylthiotransferase MtaB
MIARVSHGCRLNAAESETMARLAAEAGIVDAAIVNTCAVTAEAVRQSRQSLRRLRREGVGTIIATGCAVETDREAFRRMPEADHVVANAAKLLPATFAAIAAGAPQPDPAADAAPGAPAMAEAHRLQTRAFLQVQNGCDHDCTFCIIPHGRGRARSLPIATAVERARALVDDGVREIVLTGVDLTSYGADLDGRPRLGDLVLALLAGAPALARLRLSSIDQVEADPALIEAIGGEPRMMPHLHLSLQSGSDLTLKRMKRRHRRADAIAFCERLRAKRPEIVFGADLIAGFPTETDAMHAETLDLIEACGLTYLHVFPYSARPGTPAARMPPVEPAAIRARAEDLRAAGARRLERHLAGWVGRAGIALAERGDVGRLPDFTAVALPPGSPAGAFVAVTLTAHDGKRLLAEGAERHGG